jgi:hypothetical protein
MGSNCRRDFTQLKSNHFITEMMRFEQSKTGIGHGYSWLRFYKMGYGKCRRRFRSQVKSLEPEFQKSDKSLMWVSKGNGN